MKLAELQSIEAHSTLRTFPDFCVFEVTSVKMKPTPTGEACFMTYRNAETLTGVRSGVLMVPSRLSQEFDRKTPCAAIYLGEIPLEDASNTKKCYSLRRLPTSTRCSRATLAATMERFRKKTPAEATQYFTPRGLKEFPALTVFNLIDCSVIKPATKGRRTIVIAKMKTVVKGVPDEGELYLSDRRSYG